MTIPEASHLLIQAGALAEGGELFLLSMGKPIRIHDMARTMIHLSGLSVRDEVNPDCNIEIRQVGLRKCEKLYEELRVGDAAQSTSHPRIVFALERRLNWTNLLAQLGSMDEVLGDGDHRKALETHCALLPEYNNQQATLLEVV